MVWNKILPREKWKKWRVFRLIPTLSHVFILQSRCQDLFTGAPSQGKGPGNEVVHALISWFHCTLNAGELPFFLFVFRAPCATISARCNGAVPVWCASCIVSWTVLEGGVDSVVLAVPWRLELFVASYLIDKTRVSNWKCRVVFTHQCHKNTNLQNFS